MSEVNVRIGFKVDGLDGMKAAEETAKKLQSALSGLSKTGSTSSAFATLQNNVNQLNAALRNSAPVAQYSAALLGLGITANSVAAGIRNTTQAIQANAAAMRQAATAAQQANSVTANRPPAANPTTVATTAANVVSGAGANALGGLGTAFLLATQGAAGLMSAVAGVAGEFMALKAVKAIISEVHEQFEKLYEVTVKTENAMNRFRYASGSAKTALDDMRFAEELANRTGRSVESIMDNWSKLMATGKESGATREQLQNILVGYTEAMTVMHSTAEEEKRVWYAVNEGIGHGNVNMQILNRQIGQALPGSFTILAKAVGKTGIELRDMIKGGEVEAMGALGTQAEALHKQFSSAVDAASHSTESGVNRMKNMIFELRQDIEQAGWADRFNEAGAAIAEALKNPEFQQAAKALALGFADIMVAVAKLVPVLADLSGFIHRVFIGLGYALNVIWTDIKYGAQTTVPALKAIWSDFFGWISDKTAGAGKALAGFARSLGFSGIADRLESVTTFRANEAKSFKDNAKANWAEYDKLEAERKNEQTKLAQRLKISMDASDGRYNVKPKVGSSYNPSVTAPPFKVEKKDKGGKGERSADKTFADDQMKAEIMDAKTHQAELTAILERALARREKDERDHILEKKKIDQDALDAEIRAEKANVAEKERLAKTAKDANERKKSEGDVLVAKAKLRQLEGQRVNIEVNADASLAKLAEKMRDMRLTIEAEILTGDGKTLEGKLAAIEQKYEKLFRENPDKSDAGYIAALNRRKEQETSAAYTGEAETESGRVDKRLSLREAEIKRDETNGALTQSEAEKQLRDARLEAASALEKELVVMKKQLEVTPLNKDLQLKIEETRSKIKDLQTDSTSFSTQFARNFADSLAHGMDGAKTWAEYFKNVLKSVITFMRDNFAKDLADSIFKSLKKALSSDNNGGGWIDTLVGWFKKTFMSGGSGGGSGGGGGGFLDMFSGLFGGGGGAEAGEFASEGASLFSEFGSFFGFADGGLVNGPGTPTSDSVLARLSRDEFVIPADSVRRVGLGALEYIRNFGQLPGFATGGLVGAANLGRHTTGAAAAPNLSLTMNPRLYLDPDHAANAVTGSGIFQDRVLSIVMDNRQKLGLA